MTTTEPIIKTSNDGLIEHVLNNTSNEDYGFNYYGIFDFEGLKPVVKVDKLLSNSYLMQKIENNFKIAKERIEIKLSIKTPSTGDFLKIENKYFRLVNVCNNEEFQYCEDGSFCLGSTGTCSYSGGFNFEFGSRFDSEQLEPTGEKKEGRFWFFSTNNVRGGFGVNFKGDFKVWKLK